MAQVGFFILEREIAIKGDGDVERFDGPVGEIGVQGKALILFYCVG
jgi:hypothetical protein